MPKHVNMIIHRGIEREKIKRKEKRKATSGPPF